MATFINDRKLFVDFYTHIEPQYFQKPEVSFMFKVFSTYFTKYKQLPDLNQTLSLMRKGNKDESYIKTAETVFTAEPFDKHKVDSLRVEVRDFIKKQKLMNAISDNLSILDDDREESADNSEFIEFADKVKEAVLWKDEVQLGTTLHKVEERYKKIQEEDSNSVPSPWDTYNNSLGGGFKAKQLTLFIANSSAGKSILLDNCALHALKQGLNVVIYTMELSELVKSQRIDSSLTKIPMKNLASKQEEVVIAYRDMNSGGILYIKEYSMLSASTSDFEQHLYQLELYEGIKDIGMIVSDYLGIMKPNGKATGNAYTDQGTIAGNLRGLAQMYNCPLLTADQFGRGAIAVESIDEIHEGLMGDSIMKMRHADVVTALWSSPEMLLNGEAMFKNLKNRGGQKDLVLPMGVDFPTLTFFEP